MLAIDRRLRVTLVACLTAAAASRLGAQSALSADLRGKIDSIARAGLKASGAPSISLAVVKDGQVVYAQAYGQARLSPALPAAPTMRYSIGSVSKQITATAMLLLAEQHKLSLDDKVGKWFPSLTRANEVSIRQLLSMTSGYQDYWPQDYVMPPMLKPITAQAIVDDWAKKPLDFDPGTKWQYSNTNYVIAGMIIEKVAGMPLVDFLRQHVFTPQKMTSVFISDEGSLGPTDPERYERYGLGPPRIAPKEGRGWMFAAGELAMTASDLARWDISVIKQAILQPASYREQQTSLLLKDGRATGYGLGVYTGSLLGHRMISHGGEVSGFCTQNAIFPDDGMAVVVYANLFATDVQADIANKVATALFSTTDAETVKATADAKAIFTDLQKGTVDRTKLTSNASAYFSPMALGDFKSSLGSCGAVKEVTQTSKSQRGGMTYRGFHIKCGTTSYSVSSFVMPDGKWEQYIVTAD
ncbi:MAG TPA: serine hydrolase domain-containing protein [Gemmatimonadaceae bacterium]|jgi:CubicO group peptidase (beta-lactamase class C family)